MPHSPDDWPKLLEAPKPKPPVPAYITPAARREFIAYNYSIGPIQTCDLRRIREAVLSVVETNEIAPLGGKRCLLVNGPAGMGKSQAVVTAMLQDTARIWASRGRRSSLGRVNPWIYVEATAAGQGRALMRAINDFPGLPFGLRDTAGELLVQLRKTAPAMGLRGIVIDDAHMLRTADRDSRKLTDFLKSAITGLPVTLIFVGAGLRESALLRQSGAGYPAAEQIARRARLLDIETWAHRRGEPDEWSKLVVSINRLLAHPQGDAHLRLNRARAVEQLHRGSGGLIGVMIDWVKDAAAYAVTADLPLDSAALSATVPPLTRSAS